MVDMKRVRFYTPRAHNPTGRKEYTMIALNERSITAANGKRMAVILDIATFEQLLDELEDLEDSWEAQDVMRAVANGEELIPWEQVKAELAQRYVQQES